MSYENILLEKEDYLAILTINRPNSLNALNQETLSEIKSAIEDVKADSAIKVLIITGSGNKAFVAGADIAYMQNFTVQEGRAFAEFGQAVLRSIELMEKPVIAAVNGFALGGGCELAMACDIRLASDNAMFGQPEVGLGVMPGFGGTQRMPRLIGEGRAKELTYTAATIKVDEAYRIGLVNHIYPAAALIDQAKKMAQKIAQQAPQAVGYSKSAINKGMQVDLDTGMSIESGMFGICFSLSDQTEGMNAFLNKRKPVFK
ncbi:MAG: enoyl-CoA hydratase-related protein [Syntrophomonadaceae bacterium]|nr:enoyl-CoA hydratase-related protein [Syntrophomonadaceae bacterium]